jgi:hypothetical protein
LSEEVAEVLFTATAAVSPTDEAAVVLRAQISSSEFGRDIDPSTLRQHSTLYKEYVCKANLSTDEGKGAKRSRKTE